MPHKIALETPASPVPAQIGLPVRLVIPFIHVNAAVEPLGLTSDGAMDTPKGPDDVAWYKLGPRPGDTGSAVVAGHFGWAKGVPAVFDNLHKLRVGDTIITQDIGGQLITFVVKKIRNYGQNEIATDVFQSTDGKSHLNLITCEGWSNTTNSYTQRLVVFADKR